MVKMFKSIRIYYIVEFLKIIPKKRCFSFTFTKTLIKSVFVVIVCDYEQLFSLKSTKIL